MSKMKNILKLVLPVFVMGMVMVFLTASSASALTLEEGAEAARCSECPKELFGDMGIFKRITNVILYIVGVIAVIMLIIGGIKYVISGGDSKKVTDAKNTILYAIIGLIICVLAYAIVNFVIHALPSASDQEKAATSLIFNLVG